MLHSSLATAQHTCTAPKLALLQGHSRRVKFKSERVKGDDEGSLHKAHVCHACRQALFVQC